MKSNYVIDTNLLINDATIIDKMLEQGHTVILPLSVLEELDNMKGRGTNEERKYNARVVLRKIAEHEEEIEYVHASSEKLQEIARKEGFDMRYQDNRILTLDILTKENVYLATGDVAMRLKARAMGLNIYYVNTTGKGTKDYSGKITVDSNSMASMRFQSEGYVLPCDLDLTERELFPNQFVKMKIFGGYDVGRYCKKTGKINRLVHKSTEVSNIKVRNEGQHMMLDVLMDNKIKVITISGRAGTGKTLLALAYALEQSDYKKILLGKNTAPVDKWSYQGFTKGETIDKLLSHFSNYTSNLEFLTNCNYKNQNVEVDGKKELARLIEEDRIEVLDIASILGRSIDRKLVIIDEAQSFSVQAMQSIITRITDGSKLVIIGDLKQETVDKLRKGDKGFQEMINNLRQCESVAHVTLKQIERGKVQQEIADALGL